MGTQTHFSWAQLSRNEIFAAQRLHHAIFPSPEFLTSANKLRKKYIENVCGELSTATGFNGQNKALSNRYIHNVHRIGSVEEEPKNLSLLSGRPTLSQVQNQRNNDYIIQIVKHVWPQGGCTFTSTGVKRIYENVLTVYALLFQAFPIINVVLQCLMTSCACYFFAITFPQYRPLVPHLIGEANT